MKMRIPTTVAALIWLSIFGVTAAPAISSAQSSKQPPKNAEKVDVTQTGQPEAAAAKSSVKKTPAASQKKVSVPDPNRRWLMKQRDHSGKKITAKPPEPLKWQSKAQEAGCQAKAKSMGDAFARARFYSIQGDRCKTAQYAASFLETADICQQQCPKGFLERNGYNEQILRNMHQLKVLGTESCLGKKKPSAVKKTANQKKAPPPSVKP